MDNLGQLLRASGRATEAVDWYRRSLALNATNRTARMNLGVAYVALGQYEQALAEYSELLVWSPRDPEGYYGRGMVFFRQQRYAEAAAEWETAYDRYVELGSPQAADAVQLLATTYWMLQDWTAARSYLELAYPSPANDKGINYMLGVCWLLGQPVNLANARLYLARAAELGSPEAAELLSRLATPSP